MYAVMYRTPGGENVRMKTCYRSIDDAEDSVLDAHPWIAKNGWVRKDDSSRFDLSDGSSFVIYRE